MRGFVRKLGLAGAFVALLLLCAFAAPALASPPTWTGAVTLSASTTKAQSQVLASDGNGDAQSFWSLADGTVQGSFRAAGPGNSFTEEDVDNADSVVPPSLAISEDQYGDAEALWIQAGTPDAVNWSWKTNDVDGFGSGAAVTGDICPSGDDESDPKVAVDPNGDVVAAWLCDDGGNEVVEAAYAKGGTAGDFDTSGNPAPVFLSSTSESASNIEIAEDGSGDATVVWQDENGGTGYQQIYYSYIADGSSTFGTAQQVVTLPGDETAPSVTMDGSDDAAFASVAYVYDNSGSEDLYESDGPEADVTGDSQWGDANPLVTTGDVSTPEIFDDDSGDTALTWVVGGDAWAVVRPASGVFTAGTDLGQSDPAYPPQIAITSKDVPVEVWQQDATILAETADSGGAWSGSTTTLSNASLTADDPSLAVDAQGNAIAGWLQTNGGGDVVATVDGLDGTGPINTELGFHANGSVGNGLTFSDKPYDVWPAISSVTWDFGDGTATQSGENIVHTFAAPGTYTVSVTSTSADGNSTTSSQSITVAASAPAVPAGGLTQLAAPNDCVASYVIGCGTLISWGLDSSYQPVVSPDGKDVYVVAQSGGIVEFSRDGATGALNEIGCVTAGSSQCPDSGSIENAYGIANPGAIAISPDGSSVYVVDQTDNSIVTFTRNATTGLLTEEGCLTSNATPITGCTSALGLDFPYGVAVSPDGKNVYTTSYGNEDVAEFTRNTTTGALTSISGNDCIGDATTNPGNCPVTTPAGLTYAVGIDVSPDGNNVYVTAGGTQGDGDVAEFTRSTTGALEPIAGNACIGNTTAPSGCLTTMSDLNGTEDMAIAPDGKFAYINSFYDNAVVQLSRDATTGALSQVGCVNTGSPGGLCGTSDATGIAGPIGLAVSPDGDNLYVSGTDNSAEAAFAINFTSGAITQLASPNDCITQNPSGCGQVDATGLEGARRVTVSPDGKNVYVASQGSAAVAAFARTRQPSSTTTPTPTPRSKVTTGTEASWDSDDSVSSASATVTVTAVNCASNSKTAVIGQEEGVRLVGSVLEGTQTYYPYAGIELLGYCDGKTAEYTAEFVINDLSNDTMTFKPTGLTVSPGDPLEMSVASGQDLKVTDVNTGKSASASGGAFSAANGFDIGMSAITSNGHGQPLLSGSESDAAPFALLAGPAPSSPTVFSAVAVDGAPLSSAPGLYQVDWVDSSKSTVASPSRIAGTNSFSGDIASVPTPVTAKSADVAPVKGKVLIELPGTHKFVPLTSVKKIPNGTIINAIHGYVQITVELPNGTTQTGVFFDGEFKLEQAKSGQTTAVLAGGNFKVCPKPPSQTRKHKKHGPLAQSASASKKKPVRHLWSNAHGSFSTQGRDGAAAVRGTEWLTQDQCDGTYFKVTRDEIEVTAFHLHNHKVLVKQGHHYLAPAPGYS